jgi:MFS transporter, DHA3 family, macrolide efflux protein
MMKNSTALSLLLTSNVISGFAQGISMLSIPWHFSTKTSDYATFGLIYIVITLGTSLWSLYAGTLIDKYSRKKIFVLINVAGFIILSSVAAVGYFLGEVPSVLVYFVFAATIFIYNIHYPCLYAFSQEITERDNYGKINSILEIQGQATSVAAGAVGAFLLAGSSTGDINLLGIKLNLGFTFDSWKLNEIFVMDAVTYLAAILLISMIKYSPIETLVIHTGSIWERLKMGFTWLKEHPMIFLFGNMSHAIFVVLLVEVHLLLSPYVNHHLEAGGDVYASAEIFYALGALFAGFGIRRLFKNTPVVKAVIILMLLTVAGLVLVAFTKSIWVFFVFSILIGVTNAGTRVLRVTWLFSRTPNNMMGRTGSVFQVINILLRGIFIALLSIPFFMDGSNITRAYFAGGVFVFLSVIPLLLRYRKLET